VCDAFAGTNEHPALESASFNSPPANAACIRGDQFFVGDH